MNKKQEEKLGIFIEEIPLNNFTLEEVDFYFKSPKLAVSLFSKLVKQGKILARNEIIKMIEEYRNIAQHKNKNQEVIILICDELISRLKEENK